MGVTSASGDHGWCYTCDSQHQCSDDEPHRHLLGSFVAERIRPAQITIEVTYGSEQPIICIDLFPQASERRQAAKSLPPCSPRPFDG